MRNEVHIDFTIADFEDITHNDISDRLGIVPKKKLYKGARKSPTSNSSALITRNRWIMGSGLDQYSTFEEQMNSLLDIIEPKIDLLRPFCEKYYCEFSCAIFIYNENGESTPSVHLNARYNRIIRELDIELDIDLYCLCGKE